MLLASASYCDEKKSHFILCRKKSFSGTHAFVLFMFLNIILPFIYLGNYTASLFGHHHHKRGPASIHNETIEPSPGPHTTLDVGRKATMAEVREEGNRSRDLSPRAQFSRKKALFYSFHAIVPDMKHCARERLDSKERKIPLRRQDWGTAEK